MIKKTALALVAASVAGVSAQAQDSAQSELSVTADITYVTDYVFRGVKLAGASIQPSVEAAFGDFYAGAWHSNAISQTNDGFDSETDLYAGYGLSLTDKVSLDAGVTRYVYSGGSGGDSTEVFVGASVDMLLSPSLYYYHDFDNETNTLEASVGYSIPVDAIKASVDLSAKLGNVSGPGQDYTYGVAGVAIPYKLSETATFTIGADYVINDSENAAGFNGGDDSILIGKVGVSIGF